MFSRTLLITVLLHLLGAGHGQAGTCELLECLDCSQSLACPLCQPTPHNCNTGVPQNCTIKDFNVTVYTFPTKVRKGTDVTVNCTHKVPHASISWMRDQKLQENENEKIFQIENIIKASVITCEVKSICGDYNKTITIEVEASNDMVVLLICVGAAAAILMLFAIIMKIALKRGQAQSQARKRQREQKLENIHSTVNTITSYY
ncbi:uncharacterized protein LOC122358227 isoform X2 [Puntigrus tetrazona]|nr:uncharacterized protein LOC122358227 isoform X2 [Puntigrus tetrazona]